MQSVLILGRQPAIGLAELESLYEPKKVRPIGDYAALLDVDPCLLDFDRLGSSIKFCKLLSTLDTTNLEDIEQFLIKTAPQHSQNMPEGKMLLGLSCYGHRYNAKQILRTAVNIKQAIRTTGRSVRVVPNKTTSLSSAQIIHNRLLTTNGWDLVLIRDGNKTMIAQTVKVQDIEAYTNRDQIRPSRDPKIGMLSPKLAQTIINLSIGPLPKDTDQSICEIPVGQTIPKKHFVNSLLLDPFCGTGVIIQEATIMGYDVIGTDINPRMVDYAKNNIKWLESIDNSPIGKNINVNIQVADATNTQWEKRPTNIASETYLGKPLSNLPKDNDLKQIVAECNKIIKDFLSNIHPQIEPGTRLCIAIPAWHQRNGSFMHLPLLDSIGVIGYNRVRFEHARDDQLIYYRSNQIVARELLVLTRK